MACFLVPTAEAIVMTAVTQIVKHNELKKYSSPKEAAVSGTTRLEEQQNNSAAKVLFYKKLQWLTNLLWGGAFLLAFEHLWHGEVVPWFPFLTAASNPSDTAAMLHEMGTVGVSMAVLVTAVWVVMVLVSNAIEKRPVRQTEVSTEGNAA